MMEEINGRKGKWATVFHDPEKQEQLKNWLVSIGFYSFKRMIEAKL